MQQYFNFLNTHYDKIYVLSVQAAEKRRELFAHRFAGLNYIFFYGADKNNFTIPELIEKKIYSEALTAKNHRFGKLMKAGEIACAWSHRMIYEEMLEKGYNRVMVFEDDAVPDENRLEEIPQILELIPGDCELFYWGWGKNGAAGFGGRIKQAAYHLQHAAGFLKWDHRMISNLYARKYSGAVRKAGFHDYTYAYDIKRSAAEKLIHMQTPLQYIADNLLAHAATREIIKACIAYPPVFLHDEGTEGPHTSFIR
jgi:glycosyl transferase, family 25